MIIQGHPDILRGPRGLNGLHGFGSLPPQGSSPAYIRFLPEKGGAGIEALYQEIRDFINTPGRTDVEIEQAKIASGVSDRDVQNAMAVQMPDDKIVDYKEDYVYEELPTGLAPIPESALREREIIDYVMTHSDAEILAAMATTGVTQSDIIRTFASFDPTMPNGQSPAYARSLPENGGQGIEAFYREINDYVNSHSFYEVLSQMFRSGVSRADLEAANNYAFGRQQAQTPAEYAAAQAAITAQAAQAQQAAAAAAEPTKVFTATGQSPAYTRFLPESGGKGITALYKEISDFVGTHSNAEIQTAMTASGVSEVDVINALQVFPNRPIVKTTETVTATKDTGLALPLVVSAIAAFFVLG
jgi:hypothetical protein